MPANENTANSYDKLIKRCEDEIILKELEKLTHEQEGKFVLAQNCQDRIDELNKRIEEYKTKYSPQSLTKQLQNANACCWLKCDRMKEMTLLREVRSAEKKYKIFVIYGTENDGHNELFERFCSENSLTEFNRNEAYQLQIDRDSTKERFKRVIADHFDIAGENQIKASAVLQKTNTDAVVSKVEVELLNFPLHASAKEILEWYIHDFWNIDYNITPKKVYVFIHIIYSPHRWPRWLWNPIKDLEKTMKLLIEKCQTTEGIVIALTPVKKENIIKILRDIDVDENELKEEYTMSEAVKFIKRELKKYS